MKFKDGKAVSLTNEEKVKLALQQALNKSEWAKTHAVWATDTLVETTLEHRIDDGKSRVRGSGKFMLNRRHLLSDEILEPRLCVFDLTLCDCKDEWGLPDIELVSSKFH